ncbi:hypothetical protein HHL14_31830 [Paraburkholderia sp. G-4-1-8]|uniref:Uncharacterized protein n=1 Tax=Paraburkholderia antibiotica TaxID=2728839 RepID=A0A7Y0A2U4_9BURK|nr:hypothetical protein [Paraburkholderia antibiotica]
MARTTLGIASALVVFSVLASGSAFAQQPPAQPDAAPAPAAGGNTTHSDPIVQKRMEVRQANQKQRAANSQARSKMRAQKREASNTRNQSVQESRQRATATMSASAPQ